MVHQLLSASIHHPFLESLFEHVRLYAAALCDAVQERELPGGKGAVLQVKHLTATQVASVRCCSSTHTAGSGEPEGEC